MPPFTDSREIWYQICGCSNTGAQESSLESNKRLERNRLERFGRGVRLCVAAVSPVSLMVHLVSRRTSPNYRRHSLKPATRRAGLAGLRDQA